MLRKTLLVFCISFVSHNLVQAQGYNFFTAPNAETIQQNAIMPSDSGIFYCMKKDATHSSLYWLKNNVLTEVKSIGSQYDVVINQNGSYGKQWFTNSNKALFVAYSQYTGGSAVYITDGTTNGTDTLFSFKYGTNVNIAGMIGSDLYFSTTSLTPYQTVLYKTNFTKAGTSIVKTIAKTNLSNNYIDSQNLYMSGYLKSGAYSYSVLYSFGTDTTRLILGDNFFPAKVINGNLYSYQSFYDFTRKNLTTNAVSIAYIPDTKEADRINRVYEVLGIQNNKLFIKANLAGPNSVPNLRIYVGDITAATSKINFTELRSNEDKSIPLYNSSTKFVKADNISYFYGINGYGKPVSIFATDGTVAGTKLVQELATSYLWSGASYANSILTCGDRVYFYGSEYKIGATLHTGYAFSSGDANSGALSIIDLNAGANAQIQDIEKFQDKFIYTIGSTTSNMLYAINSCASASTTALKAINGALLSPKIYPNPSRGKFTIEMNDQVEDAELEIYNLMGQKIYSKRINSSKTVLDESLCAGVYVLKFVGPSSYKVQSQRLIISK